MPEKSVGLTEDVKGLPLNFAGMREQGWYQQSSTRYHYGLPRTRGLWVHEIEPWEQCCHHPVKLFLLVRTGAKGIVTRVETMVCQCYADGSYDELGVPFNPFDLAAATMAIEAALTSEARADLETRRATPDATPLSLDELSAVVGTYLDSGPGRALVDRLKLERTLDVLGAGDVYAAHGKPVEVHVSHANKVRTVLFTPRPFDVRSSERPGRLSRSTIREHLGPPRPHSKIATVDYDRFETPRHVTLVTYDGAGNADRISIFLPEVAP